MDVTVVVATFGDERTWLPLAERAAASVEDVPVLMVHAASLREARNAGAGLAGTEWLCFLDADDELEAGYFDAMAAATADLRAPLVRYVKPELVAAPRIPAGTDDLADGNRLVIGTLVRRRLFCEVGGFRDWPMYEDWDLWQRCWLAGAKVEFTGAVYRAHVRARSRNRNPSRRQKEAAHQAIRRANLPWLYEEAS